LGLKRSIFVVARQVRVCVTSHFSPETEVRSTLVLAKGREDVNW
jgi:hypothetical protein